MFLFLIFKKKFHTSFWSCHYFVWWAKFSIQFEGALLESHQMQSLGLKSWRVFKRPHASIRNPNSESMPLWWPRRCSHVWDSWAMSRGHYVTPDTYRSGLVYFFFPQAEGSWILTYYTQVTFSDLEHRWAITMSSSTLSSSLSLFLLSVLSWVVQIRSPLPVVVL